MSPERQPSPERDDFALILEADALYLREANHNEYIAALTRSELVRLWVIASNPDTPQGWDDEVYDALQVGYNHFAESPAESPEKVPASELDQAIAIIQEFMATVGDPDYDTDQLVTKTLAFLEERKQEKVNVADLTEPELIELSTNLPSAVTRLGRQAMDEYMRRRGEVINNAIEAQKRGDS